MSHRMELLEVMRTAWADVEGAVAGLEGRMNEDGGMGNGWRWRDVLAHVALWERMAARKIAGTPLPDGEDLATRQPWDLDAFNDGMHARWQARPEADVLAEFSDAHRALVAAVEGAGEAACAPGGAAWNAIIEDGAGHYPSHFAVANRVAERWPGSDSEA